MQRKTKLKIADKEKMMKKVGLISKKKKGKRKLKVMKLLVIGKHKKELK